MELPTDPASPSDFDFYVGNWRVQHRRLKERLKNCTEWEEFDGLATVRKVLGGYGNIDDHVLNLPSGPYRAVTLRSYNPASAQWSIWWLDSRRPDSLDVPVVGHFENGIGTFLARDSLEGQQIVVRFTWTPGDTDSPHWAQAFSADDGQTWEPNWTMQFIRTS